MFTFNTLKNLSTCLIGFTAYLTPCSIGCTSLIYRIVTTAINIESNASANVNNLLYNYIPVPRNG